MGFYYERWLQFQHTSYFHHYTALLNCSCFSSLPSVHNKKNSSHILLSSPPPPIAFASCIFLLFFFLLPLLIKLQTKCSEDEWLHTQEMAMLPASTALKPGCEQPRDFKRPLPSAVLLLDSSSPSSKKLKGFINLFILTNDPWSMSLSIYWTDCLAEKTPSSFLHTIGLDVQTADNTQSNLPVPQCWGTQVSQPVFLTDDR